MSDKIAVYIVSMGETPEAVGAFISAFCARFKIPQEKMLDLSRRLPARMGSYDLEKAQQFGIQIRRMGGQVSLRRFVPEQPAPARDTRTGGDSPDSWVVHGHAETQDDLKNMAAADTGATVAASTGYDYPGISDDVPPAHTPPPKRIIDGKYEPKQVYTADQAFGLTDERFKKVKGLYAGRKGKKSVLGSPAFRILLFLLVVAAILLVYRYRYELRTLTFGLREVVLAEAYEDRLPDGVFIPQDFTGDYNGSLDYTTRKGDSARVEVSLLVEGKNIHDVVVKISSAAADIGPYRLGVEYAPGYVEYTKTVNDQVLYSVENTFPMSSNTVGRIDERGRFAIELDAIDTGVDPNTIPSSERDHLGNMIFLKIEGAFAGDDTFYGGLLTSGSPLVGWEAHKQ